MNKDELITQLASKSGATKETAGKVLEAFIETVMQAVKNKDEVRWATCKIILIFLIVIIAVAINLHKARKTLV